MQRKILIVGGGIAGLSLGLALEQRGIAADVVERLAAPSPSGTGLYLPGNATRAIASLGLLDRVRANAAAVPSQAILDRRGWRLTETITSDVWARCGPCLSLPHARLHAILGAAFGESRVRHDVSVAAIDQSSGLCEVAFTDGRSAFYDLVVGADGIHSGVRRIVRPDVRPQYGRQVCWRFITHNVTAIEGWTAMLGNGATLLGIPVSDTQAYVYADLTLPAGADPESFRHASLPELFHAFAAPLHRLLERSQHDEARVHFGRLGQVDMDDWVQGRVVFIGDAAHAASPNMAQGAALALEDALVLAEVLAAGQDLDPALAVYSERRRHRVRWVQRQCATRDKMRALPALARAAIFGMFGDRLYRRSYAPLLAPP
ncbi:FAD-dependent monooxygenase [Massilia sp. HP4]|uniref:FAD-dependent monooxygenase n=1 Tax=Massilia sp. HP4 TaxID=2562316 RepID=UPI00197CC2EE|nr:FAD-dependent monooxygenase [Massilia sp. HP4]